MTSPKVPASLQDSKFLYHGRLWPVTGGIHPQENKAQSSQHAIVDAGVPTTLAIPLRRYKHNLSALVNPGEHVLKGQVIAIDEDHSGTVAHAPTSGMVQAIATRTLSHVSMMNHDHIVIESDGKDESIAPAKPKVLPKDKLTKLETIRELGVIGLGGAGFPSHIKLGSHRVETLIINGAECEPYITCDDRLMQECAPEIVEGISQIAELVSAPKTLIAIEDNKPEAIAAMIAALEASKADTTTIQVAVIPSIYPSGGEKQLIEILTGQQVPHQGLPMDLGILMHNVGTCYAVKRALVDREPSLSRVVTLSGKRLKQPGNYRVLIGTPIEYLLELAGVDEKAPGKLIIGGPMMGVHVEDSQIAISSESNCIIAASQDEFAKDTDAKPCIRCGDCASVCPASLLPQQLFWYAQSQDFDQAEKYNVMDCIECGACAYVCPSSIPLVHHYRFLKSEIRAQKQAQEKSQRAKERFEFREQRLVREKTERAARHRKAAEERAARAAEAGTEDANKQAILDAIKRVQAKKNKQENSGEQ